MRHRNQRSCSIALCAALLGACSGGPEVKAETPPPAFFPGFPPTTLETMEDVEASVYAEASFQVNHPKILGLDLTREGLLPIRLTLGLRGRDQDSAAIRLDPDQMDMRLYLPDGTVLMSVPPAVAARSAGDRRDKVRQLTLEPGVLPRYDAAREDPRFVFFQLPKKHEIDGEVLVLKSGKHGQAVHVTKALMAFNVMFENKLQPFYVGIGR